MNKKLKILIGILAVGIVLAGSWWVWNSQKIPERLSYERCLKLEAEISENISSIDNSCQIDSDCKPLNFGGNWVNICVNKNTNTLAVESAVKNFLKKCPFPGVWPPVECSCVENKCATIIEKPQEVTIATDKTEYEQGETVKITVKNGVKEERCVSPDYEVESFKQGKWMKIKKTWCPCEVICSIQPCKLLQPNEIMDYEWYQKESWCTGPQGRSETIYKQVDSGIYRIKIQIDKEEVYSNEFTIK